MSDSPPARSPARALRGIPSAVWPVAELSATVAAQIVLTPLLLHRLGAEQFAIWVIAQSLLLSSATLSLGAGPALLPALAAARVRDDTQGAWAAIGLFVKRTALTSLAALMAIVAAAALWRALGGIGGLDWLQLPLAAAATLAWVSATEFDSGLSAALKSLGRFDTVAHMEISSRIAQVALTAALVACAASALAPILLAAAVIAVRAGCKYATLRKRWPPARHAPDTAVCSNPLPREISIAGAWVWLGMFGGLAFYAFDRWFVGAWFGPSVLAAYAVCSQIAQLPHAVASAAGQTLVPWAARRREQLADTQVRHDARKLMLWATVASALPAALMLPVLEPLLAVWISAPFAAEHLTLARQLTAVSLLLSFNVPSYFLLFGLGEVRVLTLLVLGAGTVFVAGCLLISPGLTGFVVLRGLFAVVSLSLVVQFFRTTRARG